MREFIYLFFYLSCRNGRKVEHSVDDCPDSAVLTEHAAMVP